jgi:dUTP pyrophosphatase|tara:strand:- start:143 stop:643 length:501 start_codon:yes stop_codon:yes gene_type:complete
MILEYARLRESAQPPERANPSDAGLDLYFNPAPEGPLPHPETDAIVINPGECSVIPTGYRFGVPHGYMLEIKNRSSVASKRSLLVGACVVDSGYDGEVFVNLHNVGKEPQVIKPRDKIAQAVLVSVVHFRALETSTGNLYDWYPITMSSRGDGALGSTDGDKNEKA